METKRLRVGSCWLVALLALAGCASASDLGATGGAGSGGRPSETGGAWGSGGVPGTGGAPAASDPAMDAEEQAVYAALLAQKYAASFYVIGAETGTGTWDDVYPLGDLLTSLRTSYSGLSDDTTGSFATRNAAAYPVASNMNLGAEYVILTDAEVDQIFASTLDGWQAFYARYPDAPGIMQFSRVGFDSSVSQALVYLGDSFGSLGGEGNYYVLQKSASGWVVVYEQMIWIS